jgi:hypothetical protein
MELKRMSDYERTGKLQRKIDVYISRDGEAFHYLFSTNWWKRQKDAIESAQRVHGRHHRYMAAWGS